MTDRERVRNGLRCLSGYNEMVENPCAGCGYTDCQTYAICIGQVATDALKLLEKQDKTIESLTEEKERLLLERIVELQHNIDALHAVMQDTILVNNAIEQRKAVKWDE